MVHISIQQLKYSLSNVVDSHPACVFSLQSKAAEECDHEDESSPPVKKKRGTTRGKKKAKAAEPEKRAPAGRRKKRTSPQVVSPVASEDESPAAAEPEPPRKRAASSRGRKRTSSQSLEPVAVAASIRPRREDSGIIPQASYPAALGYVGNGESEGLEPSSKRPRPAARTLRSRAAVSGQASSTGRAKRKSPVKQKV